MDLVDISYQVVSGQRPRRRSGDIGGKRKADFDLDAFGAIFRKRSEIGFIDPNAIEHGRPDGLAIRADRQFPAGDRFRPFFSKSPLDRHSLFKATGNEALRLQHRQSDFCTFAARCGETFGQFFDCRHCV